MLPARSWVTHALGLGVLLPLTACDQWSLFVASDGVLSISIVSDHPLPHDRFRVRLRQPDGTTRLLEIASSEPLRLRTTAPGVLVLTLLPPESCEVSAPNPRTLTVGADDMLDVAFDVHCA